jgi:hypothetical protein
MGEFPDFFPLTAYRLIPTMQRCARRISPRDQRKSAGHGVWLTSSYAPLATEKRETQVVKVIVLDVPRLDESRFVAGIERRNRLPLLG